MKLSRPILVAVILLLAFGSFAATNLMANGGFSNKTESSGNGGAGGNSSDSTGKSVYQLIRRAVGQAQDEVNFVDPGASAHSLIASTFSDVGLFNRGMLNTGSSNPLKINGLSFNDGSLSGTEFRDASNTSRNMDGPRFSDDVNAGFSGQIGFPINASGPSDSVGENVSTKATVTDLPAVSPVPEPETYVMLLVGLGLIGVMAQRRSKAKLT